ncbi:MAG TPA: tetratricopeptide repeat protein [Candidatus Binataceae bacterium]|nr:tetratricopeptide repeat protein [Candidatus Binataceae bacterium]
MQFCPQCGAALVAGAKFCVECGEPLTPAAVSLPGAAAAPAAGSRARFTAFVAVMAGILVLGVVAATLIERRKPIAKKVGTVAATADAGAMGSTGLPANHPAIKIPKTAVDFINDLNRRAHAKPNDLALWTQLGDVTSRAALFDPAYHQRALEAYGHVLKLDPDNPAALRGVGNVNYDLHNYDQAIAAYEHYLKRTPGDAEVLTDLGTMYLSSGNPDQAVLQYKKALLANPKFFQAYFNLGVAYGEENQGAEARTSFEQALKLAPDDRTQKEIKQMLASLSRAGGAVAPAVAPAPASTFHGSVDQMVRALPIAGQKVSSVQWPAEDHARVVFQDFPMASMPPFARVKFLADLKSAMHDEMNAYHVAGPMTVDLVDAGSSKLMDSVAIAADRAPVASADGAPAIPAGGATGAPASSASGGDFHGAVDQMMRGLPIAGPKVEALRWSAPLKATVLMDNFPMDAMPPFMRAKFIDHIKAGLENAKREHNISGTVELDIADAASGRVMDSVSQ